MSSIDTCWTCGSSEKELRERIAKEIQDWCLGENQMHHLYGSRCYCDEAVEFVLRGPDEGN
jgi:hypothetical protein